MADDPTRLMTLDSRHWLHPQGMLTPRSEPRRRLVFKSGRGAVLTDVDGREYIDAMAALFNVNVGYGRTELAEAAAAQMRELAYSSAYGDFSHEPGIELATCLAEIAPGNLEVTYFASGGGEANDAAYKFARLYWKQLGHPERVNIVSRLRDYHGLTYGATSASGLPQFWRAAEPLAPGFVHAPAPDPYRYDAESNGDDAGRFYASALEQVILETGPETVAAVVEEPVQGAGGLIVPPPDYLRAVRAICDKHRILLIADEVITGFGRTGQWFGSQTFDAAPDIMVFAKGITSGYLPLSGVMMTREVDAGLRAKGGILPHAQTYSGHPTACVVALRNLQILEDEHLVERVAEQSPKLLDGLGSLLRHEIVGDVRGVGLLAGVELVRDRKTKASFDVEVGAARRVFQATLEAGVIVRALPGDVISISPPFVIEDAQIDRVVETLDKAIATVSNELGAAVG